MVKDRIKLFDYDVKLDDSWHLLVVLFEQSKKLGFNKNLNHKVKIFIDSLYKRINHDRTIQIAFNKQHDHILAYGVDAIELFKSIPSSHMTGVQTTQIGQGL